MVLLSVYYIAAFHLQRGHFSGVGDDDDDDDACRVHTYKYDASWTVEAYDHQDCCDATSALDFFITSLQ